MQQHGKDRWALILAGGDGIRLRPLTRALAGDERPKQFSSLFGPDTLLDQTRNRVAHVVPAGHITVIVTRKHEPFFGKTLMQAPGPLLIQAENRGTAPAILYGILSLHKRHPAANVAIFPSDHYFTDELAFIARVRQAFQVVEQRPDLIVILGIVPNGPAVDYSWIEPGDAVPQMRNADLRRIRRFWHYTPLPVAEDLLARGCLWNSLVAVGSADALLILLQETAPELYHSFKPALAVLGTAAEAEAMGRVYADLLPTDFSTEILAPSPQVLAVMPVGETGWTDLADPSRTLSLVAGTGVLKGRTGGSSW